MGIFALWLSARDYAYAFEALEFWLFNASSLIFNSFISCNNSLTLPTKRLF